MSNRKYIVTSVLLFIIGFILQSPFFEFSIEMIRNEQVKLFNNRISLKFISQLIFALIIGFIPTLYFVIQKTTKIKFFFDGFYVLLFIVMFGGLMTIFRGVFIRQELMFLSNLELPDNIKPSYSIDKLYFEYYLLLGFLIGAFMSFLLLRLRSRTQNKI